MKSILMVAALLLTGASDLTENEIITKFENQFKEVKTISATFSQTFYDATFGKEEKSSGTVRIQKPLKMVWRYDKPYEQTILSDGENLYFQFPSDHQVLVESVGTIVDSRSPVLFLAGGHALKELFTISLEQSGRKDRMEGDIRLELIPKEKSVSATKVILTVDGKSWNIKSFSIFDWTGNRTDIEFANIKINETIGGNEFKFVLPDGSEIIHMPKPEFGVKE